jgi:hypothetical protein
MTNNLKIGDKVFCYKISYDQYRIIKIVVGNIYTIANIERSSSGDWLCLSNIEADYREYDFIKITKDNEKAVKLLFDNRK